MNLNERFSKEEIDILHMRAERIAIPVQDEDRDGRVTALIIALEGEKYALPIDAITVVFRDIVVIPVPCVPQFVAGIANVRGHLVSVIDLAALMGLPTHSDDSCALVVAESGDIRVGFRIESIGDVVELTMNQMGPVPSNINFASMECLVGIFPDGITLLDVKAILNDPRMVVDEAAS